MLIHLVGIFCDVHPVLKQAIVATAIIAAIADIWRFEELRAYFWFIPVAVLCTERADRRTYSFRTCRNRALGLVFENAFMSELASAPGRLLAIIAKVELDLSADRGAILTDLLGYLGEALSNSQTSLDLNPVIICKVFHD
jgi:hypothetical protein